VCDTLCHLDLDTTAANFAGQLLSTSADGRNRVWNKVCMDVVATFSTLSSIKDALPSELCPHDVLRICWTPARPPTHPPIFT